MPHFAELLYKRSTSGRRGNCKWRETTILKHNIECTYNVSSSARAGRLLAARAAVPRHAAPLDLYARAFNALPWIIYTQIEMSHSCRSSCLSALAARRRLTPESTKPPSVFCPSIRSANRLCLLSKSLSSFWKAKLNGVPIDFHITLFKRVEYNVFDRNPYSHYHRKC